MRGETSPRMSRRPRRGHSTASSSHRLAAPRLAHFATVSGDGGPRVRPLWYVYEEGAFWFTTRLEARWTGADVAAGSPVAISIGSEDRPYRAVVARGPAEVWSRDRESW